MGEHCSFGNLFQNITTGEVKQDPAVQGGHEIADLNSAQLAHPICSPLTVPEGFNIFSASGPGELRFEGHFALATSPGGKGGSQTYLEKCGTHLHELIGSNSAGGAPGPIGATPNAVVWQQSPSNLNIEFLPSRRRFVMQLPKAARSGIAALALTEHHLYAIDQTNTLWIATVPTKPPRS
jgi:hypothetical protein